MIQPGLQAHPSITASDPWEEADFRFLSQLVEDIAGISLPSVKAPMMRARLLRRLRALNLPSIGAYCQHLRDTEDFGEIEELISALTTNVTMFYREIHHFDYLRDTILPTLMARAERGDRIRLWSAGCATGEEPYSLAWDVLSVCPRAPDYDIRILATDIDKSVLASANQGQFCEEALAPAISRHGREILKPGPDTESPCWVHPDAVRLVAFRQLNLVQPWPVKGPFQIVFCRNVLIYFSGETQRSLWPKFARVMEPGGHLFLGHSERMEHADRYGAAPVATTTYRFH